MRTPEGHSPGLRRWSTEAKTGIPRRRTDGPFFYLLISDFFLNAPRQLEVDSRHEIFTCLHPATATNTRSVLLIKDKK